MKYFKKYSLILSASVFAFSFLSGASSSYAQAKLPEETINLSFKSVELRDLLKIMAESVKLNMVLSEKISGTSSIELNHVAWNEAFEMILASKGLSYKYHGKILWVGPFEELNQQGRRLEASPATPARPPQVMIEARIVEADHRFARNLGVKLGAKTARTPTLNSDQALNADQSSQIESSLGADGLNGFAASTATAAITMFSKGTSQLLQLELSSLEASGKGNIVANPRIVTANQVKATIEQGTELPYQTSSKEGSRVQFRKANLKLEVTPKILDNSQVSMEVEISKDTIGMKTEQGYAIDTKHLKSQIIVEDGGTAVIGGIFLHTEREDVVKVPFIGDIPLLGLLFQHKAKINDKTELLVFLTPSLLPTQTKATN